MKNLEMETKHNIRKNKTDFNLSIYLSTSIINYTQNYTHNSIEIIT